MEIPIEVPTSDSNAQGYAAIMHQTINTSAQETLHALHEFFVDFIPEVFVFVLILLVTAAFVASCSLSVAHLLRRCGIPQHYRWLTLYAISLFIVFLGVTLALGAIGIDIRIIIGAAIVLAGLSNGLAPTIQNLCAGVILQFTNIFESHHRIIIGDITGEIIDMNLCFLEIAPEMTGEDTTLEAQGRDKTVFIPNALLLSQPFTVIWHGRRRTKRTRVVPTEVQQDEYSSAEHGNARRSVPKHPLATNSSKQDESHAKFLESARATLAKNKELRQRHVASNNGTVKSVQGTNNTYAQIPPVQREDNVPNGKHKEKV